MIRRIAICLLPVVLLLMISLAEAQPSPKIVRIGYLGNLRWRVGEKDFIEELRNRGWIDGQNLAIERRYWENRVERLPGQVADLLRLDTGIIVTNTGTAAQAAKKATSTVPIVMVSSADAVMQG